MSRERGTSYDNPLAANAHVSDMLAAYALGALEPHETHIVARHLQSCPLCRAELDDYRTVTELLPYAANPQPVPVRARAALLSRVDAIGTANPEQMLVLQPERRARFRRLRRVPRMAWAASSLAAVVLIAFSVSSVLMQDRIQQQQQELDEQRETQNEMSDVMLNQRFETPLSNTSDVPGAEGKMLVNLADNSALLLVKAMPPSRDNLVYVVWLRVQGEYARAGVLEVAEDGRGTLIVQPPDLISHYDMLVITMESNPDTTLPTGPEVLTSTLMPQSRFDELVALDG